MLYHGIFLTVDNKRKCETMSLLTVFLHFLIRPSWYHLTAENSFSVQVFCSRLLIFITATSLGMKPQVKLGLLSDNVMLG